MPLDAVKNFAKATVSTGYDASAVTIVLQTGHGDRFPQPSTDGAFNVVWWNSTDYEDPTDDPNVEIVRCTARSTDTLTVTRGQEGISPSTKNTGGKTYLMVLTLTKKMMDDIETHVDTLSMHSPFEVGTKMVFFQAAAPTGWTKDTDYHGHALRTVTDGSGGGTGGTYDISAAHQHSIPTDGTHDHALVYGSGQIDNGSVWQATTTSAGSHSHGGVTGGHSFKYMNIIICTKD